MPYVEAFYIGVLSSYSVFSNHFTEKFHSYYLVLLCENIPYEQLVSDQNPRSLERQMAGPYINSYTLSSLSINISSQYWDANGGL